MTFASKIKCIASAHLALSFALAALMSTSSAHAWQARGTCDGKIKGQRTKKSYVLDRQNIPDGGDRDQAVEHAMREWNQSGVDRFAHVSGDSDGNAEGAWRIHFVSRSTIDGVDGVNNLTVDACFWPYNNGNGNITHARISIASDLATGPSAENENRERARKVIIHELGHSLGMMHVSHGGTVMHGPPAIRVGSRTRTGGLHNDTDMVLPDDVHFLSTWHGDGGSTVDMVVSGQFDDGSGGQNFISGSNGRDPQVISSCTGGVFNVGLTHFNAGVQNVSCSNPVPAFIVASPDTTITNSDHILGGLQLCGSKGQTFSNIWSFTIPSWLPVPSGQSSQDYHIGVVVDPWNVLDEQDEGNNSVRLNLTVRRLAGC